MPTEIKLDLHEFYNRGDDLEHALRDAFDEAARIRARSLQIVHGKGTGQLKQRVQRFCRRPEFKPHIRRIDNDSKNWGRLFVRFRWS